MTPIIASSSATTASPDARAALPAQAPVPQPATGPRPGGRDGPLRNGNPRGNPHLAPRCGAKARTTGCACRAEPARGRLSRGAMANRRCPAGQARGQALHGGKSTGPRTPEGRASVARAHTTHGRYAQAGLGAKHRVSTRYCRAMARRLRLADALTRHLRWLPRALAERLHAYDVPELRARVHYSQLPDAPAGPSAQGQALCKAGRDARGRFAAAPPPVPRGRQAERAQARAEAATLAPWMAALKRARMVKRLVGLQDRAARRAERGQDAMRPRPTGACPGGGMVRPGGVAGEGSGTNLMNSGAGGGMAAACAEAPAAAVAS